MDKIDAFLHTINFPSFYLKVILSFITSLLITYYSIPAIIKISRRKNLMDEPGQRSSHERKICVFSFRYIVERNLIMFLLCIYLALGFHKTSIVFLPAFWLVNIPMNSKRILWALVICLLLSPLEPYKLFGEMFTSLLPQDVSGGYDAYVNDSQFGGDLEYGITDIVKIFFVITLLIFEKEGSKKIAYFEYVRNLAVFGLCM